VPAIKKNRGGANRTGAQALTLLSAPLDQEILRALVDEPRELLDLRHAVGSPPQSTMRVYTRALADLGVLERYRQNEFPSTAKYSITPAGRALLEVAAVLDAWLQMAPDGPLPAKSVAAKSATKALVGGWSATIVRALAARSLTLTELSMLIPRISYPSIERRLGAMRLARLIEAQPSDGRGGVPYQATEWLRHAVTPLTSAIAWEQRFVLDPNAQIGRLDIEAAFLLAVPLLTLDPNLTGRCRLSVDLRGPAQTTCAGIMLGVEKGVVISCTSRLEGDADASASGTPGEWMQQMVTSSRGLLEMSGNLSLAQAVTNGLQAVPVVAPLN
jgi:DNA-binding HxlR family transcriptional regulator